MHSLSKIFSFIAITLISLVFSPHRVDAWEPLKVHPLNPHLMEFRGKPQVLYTVAEHYGSVVNRDFDYLPYLNVMQRDGMNLTRLFLAGFRHDNRVPANDPLAPTPAAFIQPWKRTTTSGNALDGLGKWDFSDWNDEFFSRLDTFMQECSNRGIVVELTFFSTYYTEGEWRNSPFHPSNNVQGVGPVSRFDAIRQLDAGLTAAKEAYVRKVVKLVNRFDNFYFEIHNEPFWNEPGVKDAQEVEFHNRMLAVIREEEALLPRRHLVAHNFPQQIPALSADFDIINDHYPTAVPGTALEGTDALLRDHYADGKILAMGEADTETEPQVRLETWMFLTGGGAIYNGLAFKNTIYTTDAEAGDTPFGIAARRSIRLAAKFINSLDLVSLRRDLSWVRSGIPVGATLQAMGKTGQQYVAYFHHGKGGLVNFQLAYDPIDETDHQISPVVNLPAGSWRVTWIRPSDLSIISTESFIHSGGDRTLAAVTYQADVTLRIDRTGSGDLTSPPYPTGSRAAPVPDGSIRLTWNASDTADLANYKIYRANTPEVTVAPSQLLAEISQPNTSFTDLTTPIGETFYYRITTVDTNGNVSAPSDEVFATAAFENLPYLTNPHTIPGIIQAEDFDRGGQDIAYHDLTPSNEGNHYRLTEAVDIQQSTSGNEVFATSVGEWIEYTVDVADSGVYRMDLRARNDAAGGQVFLEVNGANISGAIAIPHEGETVTVPEIVLAKGLQVIRLVVAQPPPELTAGNINWMQFTAVPKTKPTANAGPDQVVVDDNLDGLALVTLNASSSIIGDAPISNYTWMLGSTIVATGATAEINLPLGNFTIQLTTTDTNLQTSTDELSIQVNPGGFNNGSFEEDFNSWTATGNVVVTSSAPYSFPEGRKIVAFNNDQSAPTGIISQIFATIPGQTYELTFDMGLFAYNNSQQSLQVQVTGNSPLLSQTFNIARQNNVLMRWENKSLLFTANSVFTTLTFRDLSSVTDSLDLTLDNVRVIQQISRTLGVRSLPSPGASITVSRPDNSAQSNGNTDLTRIYPNTASVTLTAATTHAGSSFSRWQKDGVDLGHSTTLNLLMDRDHDVTAIYAEGLPFLNSHPSHTVAAAGASASFQVIASSSNSISYQWRLNGNPIVGAHSSTLVIPNVQTANTGNYDVIVTNVIGSVTSSVASLSLQNTTSLVNGSFESNLNGWVSTGNLGVQSGSPYTATAGSKLIAFNGGQGTPNGTLSQSFGTTPGLLYQLNFDMGVVAFNDSQQLLRVEAIGSSSLVSQTFVTSRINGVSVRWEPKTLVFTANSPSTTLTFRDVSQTSTSLDLTLDNIRIVPLVSHTLSVASSLSTQVPISVSPPDNLGHGNGISGFTRTYASSTSVNLTAPPTHAYLQFSKWQKNGIDLAVTPNISVIMNANTVLTAVYVEVLPIITESHASTTLAAGSSVNLRVTAQGGESLIYQWRKNGNLIPNANSNSLTITNVQPPQMGAYDVTISNSAGTVTSSTAQLYVVPVAPLANGSFEAEFDGWTSTGHVQPKTNATPYSASHGSKFAAFNTSGTTPNGVLEQTFVTTPGATYKLSFDVGVLAENSMQQQIQVTCSGSSSLLSQTIIVTGSGNSTTRWLQQNFNFTADSTSSLLSFRDLSSTSGGIDLLLDNVKLSAVTVTDTGNIPPGTVLWNGGPGRAKILFGTPSTATYRLEKSTNLIHWQPAGEVQTTASGQIEFNDVSETEADPKMFYRIARPSQN